MGLPDYYLRAKRMQEEMNLGGVAILYIGDEGLVRAFVGSGHNKAMDDAMEAAARAASEHYLANVKQPTAKEIKVAWSVRK